MHCCIQRNCRRLSRQESKLPCCTAQQHSSPATTCRAKYSCIPIYKSPVQSQTTKVSAGASSRSCPQRALPHVGIATCGHCHRPAYHGSIQACEQHASGPQACCHGIPYTLYPTTCRAGPARAGFPMQVAMPQGPSRLLGTAAHCPPRWCATLHAARCTLDVHVTLGGNPCRG